MNNIKQIWKNYCFAQSAKDIYNPQNPVQKIFSRILYEAIKANAEFIILGVPTEEYELEELPEEELSEEDAHAYEEIIDELASKTEGSTPWYSSGPLLHVWHCVKKKCIRQNDGIPLNLYSNFIDSFEHYSQIGMDISEWSDEPTKVFYTFAMQENFCFSVTINKIEKTKK